VAPLNLQRGDIVRLRKEHPCGNADFEVVRLGADIGLTCTRCGRRILLARSLLERRLERFVSRTPPPEMPADLDMAGLDDLDLGEPSRPAEPRSTAP
jgi:hypothetical protein